MAIKRLTVFCGSATGKNPVYAATAQDMARVLVENGIGLVFGGGGIGLMGIMADIMLAAGAEIIGVIPSKLVERELAHPQVSDMRIVADMHQRKALMTELGDAFVALPGGIGTMEELMEALTWRQLAYHHKPSGLLNTAGFYDPLLNLFQSMHRQGFLPHLDEILTVDTQPQALLQKLQNLVKQ